MVEVHTPRWFDTARLGMPYEEYDRRMRDILSIFAAKTARRRLTPNRKGDEGASLCGIFKATQRPRRMRRLLSASSEGYTCAFTTGHSLAPHHRRHTTIARSRATATQSTAPCLFRVRRLSIPWRSHRFHDSSPTFHDRSFINGGEWRDFERHFLTILSFCRWSAENVE